MGIYLNPDNEKFQYAVNSRFYVDKTGLIEIMNEKINTENRYVCVSRPRRFGKSMAANMLTAYYSRGADSGELFKSLKISYNEHSKAYINKYYVIFINLADFIEGKENAKEGIEEFCEELSEELKQEFSDVDFKESIKLSENLNRIYQKYKETFIFIIDEWDVVLRTFKTDLESHQYFLDFMKKLLKDKSYIGLAYITGILPIKKYNTQSALNMFQEFTMVEPLTSAPYFGFTSDEVENLQKKHPVVALEELQLWYNGYWLKKTGCIFNPRSVISALELEACIDFWGQTGAFSDLLEYIQYDFEGLKDEVVKLLAVQKVPVNPANFQNDLYSFTNKNSILVALIHLGYLSCDDTSQYAFIPNREIRDEFRNAVEETHWSSISQALKNSELLLHKTLNMDSSGVAQLIEQVHDESIPILQYNDENSLACVIQLAYYTAQNDFVIQREDKSGKGFADFIFYPKQKNKIGIILELKWGKSPQEAILQIKNRDYHKKLSRHAPRILIVGINYNKHTKKHECLIEEFKPED